MAPGPGLSPRKTYEIAPFEERSIDSPKALLPMACGQTECRRLHPRAPLARARANWWGRAGLTRFHARFFAPGHIFRFWSFSRVEISGGIRASLAGRYASALFDLARDERQIDAVGRSLEALNQRSEEH